jgi:hypothetical protein
MMRRQLMYAAVIVIASSILASVASADDRGSSAQAAHDMMRQAMLERVAMPRDLPMRPDEVMARAADASATGVAAAHDHAMRLRRNEAEHAAHSRAAQHGMRQPGTTRREQERRPSGGPMHGGTMGWDGTSDMGCGDAAGNWRSMDMHHSGGSGDWMPMGGSGGSGGGMPTGGSWNLRATDPSGAGAPTSSSPPAR